MKKRNCKRSLKGLLAVLLACTVLFSANSYADFGKSGWTIFKKAEMANSRGITSALGPQSSLSGLFYNPALLGDRTQREAFIISESGFVGDRLGGFIYGEPLKNGMIAAGMVGYDAGRMDLNWIENGALVTENVAAQRDLLGFASYGRRVNSNLFVGATVKAATSEIAQRKAASAYAADVGAVYMTPKGVTLSAAVQNLGTSTKFIEKENPLPTSGYFGLGYTAKIKNYTMLTGVGATYNFVDQMITPEVGLEFRYGMISMNAGYRLNAKEAVLNLGIGLTLDNIEFGYSYIPGVYLGSTHRVNMSYKFGSFGKKPQKTAAVTTKQVPAAKTASAVKKTATVTKAKAPVRKITKK